MSSSNAGKFKKKMHSRGKFQFLALHRSNRTSLLSRIHPSSPVQSVRPSVRPLIAFEQSKQFRTDQDRSVVISGLSEGYQRVIRGLSEGYQRVIRGLLEGYQCVIRGLSEGYQYVIRGLSEGYQRVIRELSEGYQCVTSGLSEGYERVIRGL